jgi:hypothetical protein
LLSQFTRIPETNAMIRTTAAATIKLVGGLRLMTFG